MDDKYVYLTLAIPFFFVALAIFLYRKDLRSLVVKAGLIGSVIGVVSEYWYFNDYWIPLTVFESAYLPVEDIIFGFGITAVGATIYKVVSGLSAEKIYPDRKKETLIYFGVALTSLFILTNFLSVNSILVSSALFILIALSMLYVRRDLCKQAFVTSLLLVGFAVIVYIPLFNLFADVYIENYLLVSGNQLNPNLFGAVPLTEILWYFSWGLLAGTIFDYARGTGLKQPATKHA